MVASDTKGEFRVRTLEGLYHIRLSLRRLQKTKQDFKWERVVS